MLLVWRFIPGRSFRFSFYRFTRVGFYGGLCGGGVSYWDTMEGQIANELMMGIRWVQTENGQNFADSIGYKEPPMTLEDSVKGVLEQVSYAPTHWRC
jgi:hypothetical protein